MVEGASWILRTDELTPLWLSAYAALVARAGHILRRARICRAFDAAMGAILVVFGARLALERR